MKILVTGANGMLGQDLCPALEDAGYTVIGASREILDITDKDNVKQVISDVLPNIIIHCAAYTNVEKAESEQNKAMLTNAEGTKYIAEACAEWDIPLVYISTDYVFDGSKTTPYKVTDKPNPINFYGMSKLRGEEFVKQYCSKYHIIRTSWLYGHHGNNFVETMLALKDKDEIRVVDDQIGSPTWTMDLSEAIVKIIKMPYGIYHASGEGETSWYGFAREILGADSNLIPCRSEAYKTEAKRPAYSVLENSFPCRNWKAALKDYMALRIEEETV